MGHRDPFSKFEPVRWFRKRDSLAPLYMLLRQHGVYGRVHFYNIHDPVNSDLSFLDKQLLSYEINENFYPLYTVRDFFEASYPITESGRGNLLGELGERISRRVTKYFLKHLSLDGYTGGIFDHRFNPKSKNGYVVLHSDNYLLKVQNYPNLVILKKDTDSHWEYSCIKELDGLFDYRYGGERHILVLETKLDKIQLDIEALKSNLFHPLKKMFKDAHFHYILFSSPNALFRRVSNYKTLKKTPLEIYHSLKSYGVNTLFLQFHEKRSLFDQMADHLYTQYLHLGKQDLDFTGRISIQRGRIALYGEGVSPLILLERDGDSGLWREIKKR